MRTTQLSLPPDIIDLGIGQPSPSLLPLAAMRQAAAERLQQPEPDLLAYGAEEGDGYFRSALAEFLQARYDRPVAAEQLFVTAGASQGLDLICTLFSRPGDTILVEEPTYFLALRIFADHGLKTVALPMDEHGLQLHAVEDAVARYQPAFLYTVPTFHNPSGVTLSGERREALAGLGRKNELVIVADEVYHLLAYTRLPPPPMAAYAADHPVLSLGSFSKILAPGLRLGWIQGNPSLLKRLIGCGLLDSGGGLNPFGSAIVRCAIEMGLQDRHLDHLKSVYKHRSHVFQAALRSRMPETAIFADPGGGFFVWMKLAGGVDSEALLKVAGRHRTGFVPGNRFSSRGELKQFVRLSFSFYEAAQLDEGVRRVAAAIDDWSSSR